jgi:hypothetical protein
LFHQSASEQQQRLTRKRWFGVNCGGFEKFMNVSGVLDQFVSIRNCEQSGEFNTTGMQESLLP